MTANTNYTKNVLIAPLNWGLGHASRCVPVIAMLLAKNTNPIIASDGAALTFLQREFPQLTFVKLPSYNIRYSRNGKFLKWKLFFQIFSVLQAVKAEKKMIDELVRARKIDAIISDNRFGVYHSSIPAVYITHQLRVDAGFFSRLTTKFHQKYISKFDECWIPDSEKFNFSGMLSRDTLTTIPKKYLGVLSRLEKKVLPKKVDIAIVLSGPEPQRSILEEKLMTVFSRYTGNVVLVRGVFSASKTVANNNIEIVDYLSSKELSNLLCTSELIIARSGYTTILDLAKIGGKAFFIPTPGQNEQMYLANYLHRKKIAPFCSQEKFTLKKLETLKEFSGFDGVEENFLVPILTDFLEK